MNELIEKNLYFLTKNKIVSILILQVLILFFINFSDIFSLVLIYKIIFNLILAIFTWYTFEEFENHVSFYGFAFLIKLVSTVFVYLIFKDHNFHILSLPYIVLDLAILIVLGIKLNFYNQLNNDAYLDLNVINQLTKNIRTNKGDNLAEYSNKNKVLLIFVRHFGCTFCRENVDELSRFRQQFEQLKIKPIFVHMSDPSYAEEFFNKYYQQDVVFVSDPTLSLYKAFGLKRGSLMQLFGISTWMRGFYAGVVKGFGLGESEGDVMQLGGYFLYYQNRVEFFHPYKSASEKFNLKYIKNYLE